MPSIEWKQTGSEWALFFDGVYQGRVWSVDHARLGTKFYAYVHPNRWGSVKARYDTLEAAQDAFLQSRRAMGRF